MTLVFLFCLIGIIAFVGYSMVPNVMLRILKWHCLWRLPTSTSVAMTFDDGPDAKYTPRLLDVLERCGVRATFFVVAEKAVRHPDIMRQMIQAGHDVQIHGYTHAFLPLIPPAWTTEQLTTSRDVLREQFGVTTNLYRPPWGLCNLTTLCAARRHGFHMVTWSIMVGDWRNVPADELLRRILRRIHPGAVIVLHDSDETWGSESGSPEQVIALIPTLMEQLKKLGYRVGSLAELYTPPASGQA